MHNTVLCVHTSTRRVCFRCPQAALETQEGGSRGPEASLLSVQFLLPLLPGVEYAPLLASTMTRRFPLCSAPPKLSCSLLSHPVRDPRADPRLSLSVPTCCFPHHPSPQDLYLVFRVGKQTPTCHPLMSIRPEPQLERSKESLYVLFSTIFGTFLKVTEAKK